MYVIPALGILAGWLALVGHARLRVPPAVEHALDLVAHGVARIAGRSAAAAAGRP